jgi:hypothetical protein
MARGGLGKGKRVIVVEINNMSGPSNQAKQ